VGDAPAAPLKNVLHITQAVLEQPDALGPPPGGHPSLHGRPGGTGRDRRGTPPRRRPYPGRRSRRRGLRRTAGLATRRRSARPRCRRGGRRRRRSRRAGQARVTGGQRPAEEVLVLGGAGRASGVLGEQQPAAEEPAGRASAWVAGQQPAARTRTMTTAIRRISTTSCRARRRSGRLEKHRSSIKRESRDWRSPVGMVRRARAEATAPGQGRVGSVCGCPESPPDRARRHCGWSIRGALLA
jgi:hypothetical protein